MPGSPLSREIEDIKQSNGNKDYKKIRACIINYDKIQGKSDEVIKTSSGNEQSEYFSQLAKLDTYVKSGINILNEYIEATLKNFSSLSPKDKRTFIKVVGYLININSLDIRPTDTEELCKIFLTYLSTASEQDDDIFNKIYRVLTLEIINDSEKDKDGNLLKNIWASSVSTDNEFLPDLLRNTYGRNYQALRDIFLEVNDVQVFTEIDSKLFCSVIKGDCNKFITNKDNYFVAYPFSEIELESKIIFAFKSKFSRLEPLIAKDVLDNSTVLCQVCQFILSSKFGVFVLNKHTLDNLNRYLPNPNVTLELGLAIGHGKKYIMLVEEGTTILSDMQGYHRINYSNIDEIPEAILNKDLSNVYCEEI